MNNRRGWRVAAAASAAAAALGGFGVAGAQPDGGDDTGVARALSNPAAGVRSANAADRLLDIQQMQAALAAQSDEDTEVDAVAPAAGTEVEATDDSAGTVDTVDTAESPTTVDSPATADSPTTPPSPQSPPTADDDEDSDAATADTPPSPQSPPTADDEDSTEDTSGS